MLVFHKGTIYLSVFIRSRCPAPDEFNSTNAELHHLMEMGIMRIFTIPYASLLPLFLSPLAIVDPEENREGLRASTFAKGIEIPTYRNIIH